MHRVHCHSCARDPLIIRTPAAKMSFQPTLQTGHRRRVIILSLLAVFLIPLLARATLYPFEGGPRSWRDADWSSTRSLPPASAYPQARVLVLSGRTGGWKGVVAVHSWIVLKRANAPDWTPLRCRGLGQPGEGQQLAAGRTLVRHGADRRRRRQRRRGRGAHSPHRSGGKELPLRQRRRLSRLAGTKQQHLRRRRAACGAGDRRRNAAQRAGPRFPPPALCRLERQPAPASRRACGACSASRSDGSKASRSTCLDSSSALMSGTRR